MENKTQNKTRATADNVVKAVETVENFAKTKLGNPFLVDALLHSLEMVKKYAKDSEQKTKKDKKLIVSRHETFVSWITKKLGLDSSDFEVAESATSEMLKGREVITSSLPLNMLAECKSAIVVDLSLPRNPEERGKALQELEASDEAYTKYLLGISKYEVKREVL